MGKITILHLFAKTDDNGDIDVAIPVENFPIIPIGSPVQFKFGEYSFEELNIEYYTASNYAGNHVSVSYDADNPGPGQPNREQLLAMVRVVQPSDKYYHTYSHIYPETIVFG